ncbi:MAG: isochorismatase family protein [Burkholderiales bacterium]|nr:isochorismatase family protein [Burkholderiales bacterium]
MTTALVLIDLQNDYFPGGTMELAGADDAVAQAGALLQAFRARAWPIVHVRHIAKRPGATFFLPGTKCCLSVCFTGNLSRCFVMEGKRSLG